MVHSGLGRTLHRFGAVSRGDFEKLESHNKALEAKNLGDRRQAPLEAKIVRQE
jgi:hypothetical protein